jgi:hypothetical protein
MVENKKGSPDRAIPRTFVETFEIIVKARAIPLRSLELMLFCYVVALLRHRGYMATGAAIGDVPRAVNRAREHPVP